jgi:hypothetical protein
MSQMDFLINFENVVDNVPSSKNSSSINDYKKTDAHTYSQPSKLIDYSIVNRPVLSIGNVLNEAVVMEFLNRNYESKMVLPELKNYDIKVVSQKFLMLVTP